MLILSYSIIGVGVEEISDDVKLDENMDDMYEFVFIDDDVENFDMIKINRKIPVAMQQYEEEECICDKLQIVKNKTAKDQFVSIYIILTKFSLFSK